ncbi:MAG: nucleotidyltransferase family protein [Marinobacter sp.]|uniref:nucleotidyltransferase family protein n=1 Tax=Marinobacter sp. TaxID=50741 RepID=UPI00299CF887|nr:nucleotidyltransferase family protein [Marinobacter sp.]MDX1754697.1 nucleotidyltransferase family protein [Marinobacter sp.]
MKDWHSVLVSPNTSLNEAIATLDKGALRIVLVVDKQNKLLGTLTDGDVRRALMAKASLDKPVAEVMCDQPQVARSEWTRDRILSVMERSELLQLPVVDENGCLVGLETLHGLLERNTINNPVFLMAGGFGTRLRPLTYECPKPMLKVGEKPILELILESFVASGFHRFFISTHYLPDQIRDYFGDGQRWGVSIQYVHEDEPLGTGGALGLLPKSELDLPIVMMNGDLLTTLDYRSLLDFHDQNPSVATMCVREFEYQVPYGVVQCKGDFVEGMTEKPIQKYFINAGIYVVSPELAASVKEHQRVDMPTLLENAMARGDKVTMFPVHEYWLDVGRMNDFQRAQDEYAGEVS